MKFENLEPFEDSLRSVFKMLSTRRPAAWPAWRDFPPQPKPLPRVEGSALRVSFINHATLLIQYRGLNLLTDPIYGQRCSPVEWAGPKRAHAPGIAMEDLPHIHAILLSHNHYDHMHIGSLRKLLLRFDCPIYTGLNVPLDLP